MKNALVGLGMVVFAVIVAAAGEATAAPQQDSAPNPPSAAITAVHGFGGVDRLTFLTKLLALTPDQQEQAKVILDDEQLALESLIDEMKQASAPLESAEKSAAPDVELEQLASKVGSVYSQMVALEAKAASKIYAELTPQQRSKVDELRHTPVVPVDSILGPVPMSPETVTVAAPNQSE